MKETTALEAGMYVMPESAGCIPLIFRQAQAQSVSNGGDGKAGNGETGGAFLHGVSNGEMGTDGFEIVVPSLANSLVSDPGNSHSRVGSSGAGASGEDDEGDYDTEEEDAFFAALNSR